MSCPKVYSAGADGIVSRTLPQFGHELNHVLPHSFFLTSTQADSALSLSTQIQAPSFRWRRALLVNIGGCLSLSHLTITLRILLLFVFHPHKYLELPTNNYI